MVIGLTRIIPLYDKYHISGKDVFGLRGPITELPKGSVCLIVDVRRDESVGDKYVEVICDKGHGWIPAVTRNFEEIHLT